MILPRTVLVALVPIALHALAREADRGLGLVLRAEVEPDGLVAEVARGVVAGGGSALVRVASGVAVGLAAWLLLAWVGRRRAGGEWSSALAAETAVFLPLLLRPAVTLLALVSVAAHPSYPYGFTLPVALTQDWGLGQDLAALAAIVALRVPRLRVPAPRTGEVLFLAFLGYALLVPEWALRWEGHPGNEPKYLRQAVALGQFLTFDAEGVSAGMEELPVRPLAQSLPAAVSAFGRESGAMAVALARGEVGRDAIRATRITRQTVRGKDGGVFYVLAPGPSLMLSPALRFDRAINRARGDPGRVAVSVLLWCALAGFLVAALFRLVRDATGRPGLASALALGFALVPPFLFYSFQFYPEMVGALVLAVVFRTLALRPEGLARHPWLHGWLLATLPWLHQKFLPVWLVLVATSVWVLSFRGTSVSPVPRNPPALPSADPSSPDADGAPRDDKAVQRLAGLLVPTLVSLYLTALYNFAITGSVRPDALFLAWGPGGVTNARVGQGVLGLLLDARYGILPYVPVLMLAAGGLALGGARRFAVVLPAALVYYLTVASADNWAGAVCNLGRYFMPVAPLAVVLVAIALSSRGTSFVSGPEGSAVGPIADPSSHGEAELVRMTDADPSSHGETGLVRMTGAAMPRGLLTLFLMLAAWTAVFAVALWRDPHAASDSALLLARSAYADGHQYIPDLFIRRWSDAAPGLWARVAAWLAALAAISWWLRRVWSAAGRSRRGPSPLATLATVAAVVLSAGLILERWPTPRRSPSFADAIAVPGEGAPAPAVFLSGAARMRYDEAVVGPGAVELLLRSPAPVSSLTVTVGGQGSVLTVEGLPPIVLRPTGALVSVPFVPYHEVRGRDGRSIAFTRAKLSVAGEAVLRVGAEPVDSPLAPAPEPSEMEPEGSGDR